MLTTIAQALCDQTGIALIRFDPFPLLGMHGSRRKDDTFDPGPCELMVKRISKAASLTTAFNGIIIVEIAFHLQRFNEADNFFVARGATCTSPKIRFSTPMVGSIAYKV